MKKGRREEQKKRKTTEKGKPSSVTWCVTSPALASALGYLVAAFMPGNCTVTYRKVIPHRLPLLAYYCSCFSGFIFPQLQSSFLVANCGSLLVSSYSSLCPLPPPSLSPFSFTLSGRSCVAFALRGYRWGCSTQQPNSHRSLSALLLLLPSSLSLAPPPLLLLPLLQLPLFALSLTTAVLPPSSPSRIPRNDTVHTAGCVALVVLKSSRARPTSLMAERCCPRMSSRCIMI